MTRLTIATDEGPLHADLDEPLDISIPYDFAGEQPSHFDAAAARAAPMRAGSFVGDVRLGGSCNCEELQLVPHCNGTHTECVGHVTAERVSVHQQVPGGLALALLLSASTVPIEESAESADPAPHAGDHFITARVLEELWERHASSGVTALVLRSLPNDPGKRTRHYASETPPPFLSNEAAALCVARDIEHLLIDLPSIDRTHDEGRLSAHRIFWGLPPGSSNYAQAQRPRASVTELIFVPDSIADGRYLLDLQIAPFVSDAAPSRPVLYRLRDA
jgi:kynurenine formamidase